MTQVDQKQLLKAVIRKIMSEELKKFKTELRTEFYSALNEIKQNKHVSKIAATRDTTKSPIAVSDILRETAPFTRNELQNINMDSPSDIKSLLEITSGFNEDDTSNTTDIDVANLPPAVRKTFQILASTDFDAKVKAMEAASKKRREMM